MNSYTNLCAMGNLALILLWDLLSREKLFEILHLDQ